MSVEVIAISGAAIVVVTALIATLFARRNMSSSRDSVSSRDSDDRYHSASSWSNGVFGGTRRTRNVRRSKRRF